MSSTVTLGFAFAALAVFVALSWLAWLAVSAAYTNGFCDGTRYMAEGPTYPSKPSPDWHGWAEVEKLRGGGSRP